jgi:hypothetical protein
MKRKNSEVHWVTPDRNVTATYDKTGVPSYPQGKKAPPAHQIARDESIKALDAMAQDRDAVRERLSGVT